MFSSKFLSLNQQKEMANKRLVYLTSEKVEDIDVFAICDGLGGHKGGDVASSICVEELSTFIPTIKKANNEIEIQTTVQQAVNRINKKISHSSKEDKDLAEMGTTLILLVKFHDSYMFFNIGDSRAYYFNANKIVQLTRDHTEGQRMLDLNILTREDLKNFKDRFTLTRYLGLKKEGLQIEAENHSYRFKRNGYILLCSDGISDSISNKSILRILNSSDDLMENSKKLIKTALKNDQADNLSLIIIPVFV